MKKRILIVGVFLNILISFLSFPNLHSSQFDSCDDLKLDSQTQLLLKKFNDTPLPPLDDDSLKILKNIPLNPTRSVLPQIRQIENIEIPSPIVPIKTRLYFPREANPLPVFVFFHGGGWALGSVDDYDNFCQEICYQTPCIVASIEYHLAPEYKFPQPLNDCYFATNWISQHIQQFGGDPTRLAIGGDSAGGNLAAAVTLMARDKGTPKIHEQVLIYPVLNDQFDTLSYFIFAEGYFLTRQMMQFFWMTYLPQKIEGKNPYASPLQALTLSNLPPALIVLANFDPLRDEGLAYAWRLHKDGVPVTLKRYHSIHGFMNFAKELNVAHQSFQTIAQFLNQSFYPK
jgi:acetyl esterase